MLATYYRTSPTDRHLAISLCAGVGGLDLGVAAAGFEIGLAVEADTHTAFQYQINFPDTDVLCADVAQLSGQQIRERITSKYPNWDGQIALLCGGPPCQGFSRMGKRDLSDPRSQLINHFVRLVGELQPETLILENVAGLLDAQYATLVSNIKVQLHEFGYSLEVWQLNAADYGVPQSRQRVFFVGNRLGKTITPPPACTKLHSVGDALSSLAPLEATLQVGVDAIASTDKSSDYTLKLHSVFPAPPTWNSSILTGCSLTRHSVEVVTRFKATAPGKLEAISHFPRLSWEGVAPTLRAGTGSDRGSHTAPRPIHPEYNRVITVREAARLSSFPDWFQFDSSKWRGFRQVGNAVPPMIARAVARQVIQAIQAALVCGVDEARRGCLFEPVVSCGLVVNSNNQKNFQLIENSVEEPIVFEVTASTQDPVELSSLQPKQRQARDIKVSKLSILECSELETEASSVLRSSFDRMKTSFMGMIEEGRKLLDIKFGLHTLHGEEKGEKNFKHWLSSSDWGGLGKSWASSAVQLAEWWMTLPKHVQEWLPSNIQGWSAAAIKRLPVASAIGQSFMMALVTRGKQSANRCDRALKSALLKTDDYAVVVCADPWKGEIGKVTDIAKDKTITLEFPGGVTKSFAPEKIEKWTLEVPDIAVGSRVIVSGDQTWEGAIGTVVGKGQPNGWWVVLDKISASGSTTKNLFKTAQLSLRTSEQVFAAPELPVTEADWQDINRLYKLSPENEASVREQAVIMASESPDADGVVNVSLGHIQQVLNDYGFKPALTRNKKNSNQAVYVYTEADLAAERAKWEEEKLLLEQQLENRIRAELTVGLKTELEREAEQKVKQKLIAADTLIKEVTAKYQQALLTLESVKEQVAQVNQLTSQIDVLTKENESLKQQIHEQAANPNRWQNTFTEQAGKVINSELEAKYEPLVQKLEEMTTKVQQQEEELKQYRNSASYLGETGSREWGIGNGGQSTHHSSSSLLPTPHSPLPPSDLAVAEVEEVASELGSIGEQLSWTGWTARGYRSQDGNRYTGLAAIKAFINDVKGAIAPPVPEGEMAF